MNMDMLDVHEYIYIYVQDARVYKTNKGEQTYGGCQAIGNVVDIWDTKDTRGDKRYMEMQGIQGK